MRDGEEMMQPRGYVVIDVEVHDQKAYAEYLRLAEPTHAPFQGKFLVRGGNAESLEDTWLPKRFVIIEFPTRANAKAWYESQGYQHARKARLGAAKFRAILVDGVPPPTP